MAEAADRRDLLPKVFYHNKFGGNFDELRKEEEEEEKKGEAEIELSLGLSLNGRFGVDPRRPKNPPLFRSSSVSDFFFTSNNMAAGASPVDPPSHAEALSRTCSLPAETEVEWRKRKLIQSQRRMEAKRKRLEKMKSVNTARDHVVSEPNSEENGRNVEGNLSIGTQGSSSSGISESEHQPNQGANIPGEARSPASVQSLSPKCIEQRQMAALRGKKANNSPGNTNVEVNETMKNMMVDMPCVSTRGVGPNGKRVDGFLYRYRKGEEVRIVCVCHGSFLSPAEFVRHAGGVDVVQPLKHIVVNPSPLL